MDAGGEELAWACRRKYREAARAYALLARYAMHKALRESAFKGGRIDQVRGHEARMRMIYDALPEWAKW
jgi:hypothetical protein